MDFEARVEYYKPSKKVHATTFVVSDGFSLLKNKKG